MKLKRILLLLLVPYTLAAAAAPITYQGQLKQNGDPFTGIVDLEIGLFDAESEGNQVGSLITLDDWPVEDGLFQAELDFTANLPAGGNAGAFIFDGPRWLEITVDGQLLTPRQKVTAAPVAIHALSGGDFSLWSEVEDGSIFYGQGPVLVGAPIDSFPLPARLVVEPAAGEPAIKAIAGGSEIPAITGVGEAGGVGIYGAHFGLDGYAMVAECQEGFGGPLSDGSNPQGGDFCTAVRAIGVGEGGVALDASVSGQFGTGVRVFTSTAGSVGVSSFGHAESRNFFQRRVGIGTNANDPDYILHVRTNTSGTIGTGGVRLEAGHVQGFGLRVEGVEGSRNYFQRRVGIGNDAPNADYMLHLDGVPESTGGLLINAANDFPMQARINGTIKLWLHGNGGLALGGSAVPPDNGLHIHGLMKLGQVANTGSQDLCRNTVSQEIAQCSSSRRYKEGITGLETAAELVRRLRPVSFRWLEGGGEDIGLVAEEVAEVEPRLVTWNDGGEIEGVRYRQLTAVLIKALQEREEDVDAALAARDARIAALEAELAAARLDTESRLVQLEMLWLE